MKRLLVLLGFLVAGLWQPAHSRAAGKTPVKPATITIPAGWPKTLVIPKMKVSAPVESLALTNRNDFNAPYRWNDVAWFDRGNRPGTQGRSVMFGHLDSTCCPAVFYLLRTLDKGDIFQVQYKKGLVKFEVMWQHTYPNAQVPWGWLYAQLPQVHERGLSLITCTGVFHRDGSGYDHKLVVYARMVLPNGKLG